MAGSKGGRPSKYKPEFAGQAEKLCELGATDEELARFFGVEARTIYRWQAQHEEFCRSLKAGKEAADDRVERSLYHKAVGYKHDAVKIFMPAGAKEPVYAPYTEHVPPDTTAAIFWLKNRRKEDWRDRHDYTGSFEHRHLAGLSDETLANIAAGSGKGASDSAGSEEKLH